MTPFLTFRTCLVMLYLLVLYYVYFLHHLWMTGILFDVNIYCIFFSICKLVNWVISYPLEHKDLKNLNFSHIFHMLIGLIRCLILLKIGHIYFQCLQTLASHLHLHNAESKFLDSHKHFVNLYHQTCQLEYSCEEFMKKKLKMNDNKKLYFQIDSGTSTDQIFALLDNVQR